MDNIFKRIRRWRDVSVSRGQLARFDPRTLDDLGVGRSDIDRIVHRLHYSR